MSETKISQNNVDPNGAEAWKLMMSSMIKFIHASTDLMNTYNKKARKTGQTPSPKCETECIVCLPEQKRKCGVCAALATAQNKETAENVPNTENATAESVTKTEKETAENVPKTEKATAESEIETPTENDDGANQQPESETAAKDSDAPKSDTDACVCAELREIKEQASKVGVSDCICSGASQPSGKCRKSSSKPQMCACPVSPKEKVEINNMMMEKINEAQKEIDMLRQELQKFQLAESAKNMPTAALYKQIMKESTIQNSFLPEQALIQQKLPEANPYSQRAASYPRGPTNQPCVFASWTYEEDTTPAFGINEPGIETTKNWYQQIDEENCICISPKRVPSPTLRTRTTYMPAIATSQPVTSVPSSFGARSDYFQNGSNVMECVYQRPKKRSTCNTQYKPLRPSTDEQSAVKNLARSYQAGGFTYSQGAKQMTSGNICSYPANYDQKSRVNARNLGPSRMPSAGNQGSRQSQRNNKEFDIYEVDDDDDEGCDYGCDDDCEG